MFSNAFFGLIALLYYLSALLLAGMTLLVACSRPAPALSRLRRVFVLLALSLLAWLSTLFLEVRAPMPSVQIWLGHINFSAIVFVVYFALRFVQEVPVQGSPLKSRWTSWLLAETGLLATLTLLTPLVDAREFVETGRAVTGYGALFPFYLLHVLSYLTAALFLAFQKRNRAENQAVRGQLTLIGVGILATGGISLVTNALLPYAFQDFRFSDVGTLSTLLFLLAVAYATFTHRLFDLQVIFRKTLIYGTLLAFVSGAYSSCVFLISQYLMADAKSVTQFAVLLIAFSFDPLRRFLEHKTDHLLFGKRRTGEKEKKQRRRAVAEE